LSRCLRPGTGGRRLAASQHESARAPPTAGECFRGRQARGQLLEPEGAVSSHNLAMGAQSPPLCRECQVGRGGVHWTSDSMRCCRPAGGRPCGPTMGTTTRTRPGRRTLRPPEERTPPAIPLGLAPRSGRRSADPPLHARQSDLERQSDRDVKVCRGGLSPLAPTNRPLCPIPCTPFPFSACRQAVRAPDPRLLAADELRHDLAWGSKTPIHDQHAP